MIMIFGVTIIRQYLIKNYTRNGKIYSLVLQ